ncbi:MAG: hypothetical protein ACO28Q_08620 [Ilumatobacteraceae bacterium]
MSTNANTDATRDVKSMESPAGSCRSPLGTYPECPLCGGDLFPEHAHFKCSGCGWRDSCCD